MNLTQILTEKISMIGVGMQRTLENAAMNDYGDYGKDREDLRTVITSGIESGISAAEAAATLGAVTETIRRTAAVTPRKEWMDT